MQLVFLSLADDGGFGGCLKSEIGLLGVLRAAPAFCCIRIFQIQYLCFLFLFFCLGRFNLKVLKS